MSTMLSIPSKKSAPLDLYNPLRAHIASTFSENSAQLHHDDLTLINQLRLNIQSQQPQPSPDPYLSYYRALSAVESRLPLPLPFTWSDAFKPSKKSTIHSISFEKSAVLFNLGAVYSKIANGAGRGTAEGLRVACSGFQSAAGAFRILREAGRVEGVTVDLSGECGGMLEKAMLAQAQECFFDKVVGDGKGSGLCSKVARQVGLYYEEAYAALTVPPLSQHFDRAWISHVQLKAALFNAEACYRYSLELHGKEEIAEEIARLKIGLGALTDAKKSAKGVAQSLLNAVNRLETNMNKNLVQAMKENDQLYLMRVPPAGSLSALPAVSLVKSTPLNELLDSNMEGLFTSLVPESSTKALSKYTDMADNIIRIQAEKMQQGSEITRVKLKEMDLPDSILALEGNSGLPLDLKEDVEAVQISGGPFGLELELQQLKDLRRVNQELLVQTEELLQKEANEDAQFRTQFGTRWTRPQSVNLTKSMLDRINRLAGNLKQAADSDSKIERAVRDNFELMSILDRRPIESALPNLARPIMSLDGNEDAILGALKQSLRELENLSAQRAALEDMLKEIKRKDDILPKLLANTGSQEDLFRKELAKYDQICHEITENIEEQEKLLLQTQAQNEEFASVFNLEDYKVAREKSYKQLAAAVAKYRESKDNINEGLKFYVTLQDAITSIKQQCSDFVMTRKMQCREMIEDVQRQIAGLNFGSDQMTNNDYPSVGHSILHGDALPQTQSPAVPSHPQPSPSYHQPHTDNPRPGYSQPYSGYTAPQQPSYTAPQQPPYVLGGQYQHNYGQPAYPGWHGPYYNTPQQQHPPSPYSAPNPYPPNQGNYYYHPQ